MLRAASPGADEGHRGLRCAQSVVERATTGDPGAVGCEMTAVSSARNVVGCMPTAVNDAMTGRSAAELRVGD